MELVLEQRSLNFRTKLFLRAAQWFKVVWALWPWLKLIIVTQSTGWSLEFGRPIEAESSLAWPRASPVPRMPGVGLCCNNLFQGGCRPAAVCLQLESEQKEMGLDCSLGI